MERRTLKELCGLASSCSLTPPRKAKVPDLIECLSDKESQVLYWACVALGNMGDAAKQALPELEKLKQNGDALVMDAAAKAVDSVSQKQRVDDATAKKKKKGQS